MIEEFKEKYKELAAKKRAELEGALERGEVHDPISGILITMAISAAISAASYMVSMAFAPKPPKRTIGALQGSLQLQNSEQGIMIPEIYGAGPPANIVAGASPTWQNIVNSSTGGNGSITKNAGSSFLWNAGATHNTSITSGEAVFKVIRGAGDAAAGFFTSATGGGFPGTAPIVDFLFGVYWEAGGAVRIVGDGEGLGAPVTSSVSGDTFTMELRAGRFRAYKNSAELFALEAIPSPTYPLWFGVVMYTIGSGASNTKVQIGSIGDPANNAQGGMKVPAIIDWSSGIRKNVSVSQTPTGGKGFMGGQSQTTENVTYDIDLGLTYARGPLSLLREYANADVMIDQTDTSLLLTGVYDPTTGADADYDPELPPDPGIDYLIPFDRVNADIPFDGDGVGTGSVQGGGSNFAVYSGTETQDPDPTEEADVDARHGSGSTPAHRGKARIVHTNFDLSRWGGIVPNMTAVWENPTLATLDDIYASLCERVNVKAATSDYDFSGISTIQPRGMLIAGRLFSPAEVMGSPEIQTVYNYFVTEAEGQIVSYIEGAEPTVTIADTEVGWMDSDGDVADILPEVDTVIASEIGLAREVHVKYIDLDKEWEPNTQSDNRQITEGVSTEVVEVQLAMLATEARVAAQRKLYRDYVAGSVHKFTLPWTYLYIYPGYKVTITRAEGFNHVLKLTSISGGVGVLECEGVAIEPAAYTQPAVGSIILGNPPPQAIPAMTILSLLDTPLLRDGDETNNNGIGFYACGTPRTGFNQTWLGFALYRSRNSVWGLIGSSDLPGTIGTVVSATGLNTDDPSVWDRTGVIVVDLYGVSASLSSVTEQDILADSSKNLALFGDMVSHFATAVQVPDFPNRWSLSILLNGRKGTEEHVGDTFTGLRFVLIDAAVVFIPAMITDVNGLLEYRGVTSGQSLADAATVDFPWTGEVLKCLAPSNVRGKRNSQGDLLVRWTRRSRLGAGMTPGSDVPLGEEVELYDVEFLTTGDVLKRTLRSVPGTSQPSLLRPTSYHSIPDVSGNNLIPTNLAAQAFSDQYMLNSGSWIEAALEVQSNVTQCSVSLITTATLARLFELSVDPFHELVLNKSSLGTVVTIKYNGVLEYTATLPGVKVARIRIVAVESELLFYWDYTGEGSVPFHASTTPFTLPLVPVFTTGGAVGEVSIKNVYIGNNIAGPSVFYTAEQQTEDGFTPNVSTIRTQVYQISSIVGRGHRAQEDL